MGLGGYAIGYAIFEGNTYEGHTLIPFLEKITARFELGKPVVVADAGLLSKDKLKALQQAGYHYILGPGLKTNLTSSNVTYRNRNGKRAKSFAYRKRMVPGSLLHTLRKEPKRPTQPTKGPQQAGEANHTR